MSKPITLWRPQRAVASDDACTTIVKYACGQTAPAPYDLARDSAPRRPACYIPSLQSLCVNILAQYPNQLHGLESTRLLYKPPETKGDYDLLRELIPAYGSDPPTPEHEIMKTVDPRLWATLVQIYTGLPAVFRTYELPLGDAHLPLLQEVPCTPNFALVTVLNLRACKEVDDDTIVHLGQLHSLVALDVGATVLTQWGLKKLAKTLLRRGEDDADSRPLAGPWSLRILRMRDCMNVDNTVLETLLKFPLLSVIDLRGTACTEIAFRKSPYRPSTEDNLYHPTALMTALATLEDISSSPVHSHTSPFYLHIKSLEHKPPSRPSASFSTAMHAANLGRTASRQRLSDSVFQFTPDTPWQSLPDPLDEVAADEGRRQASRDDASRFYWYLPSPSQPVVMPNFGEIVNRTGRRVPDPYETRAREARRSRPTPQSRAPDGLRLYRAPPPWSTLDDIQRQPAHQRTNKPHSTRSRGELDDRPLASAAVLESAPAKQTVRAMYDMLERRLDHQRAFSSSSSAQGSACQRTARVNPFSRQMIESSFPPPPPPSTSTPSTSTSTSSAAPARKRRRVSREAATAPADDDIEDADDARPVAKSTLPVPPRSTKGPLKPIFALPRPIFPEQEAKMRARAAAAASHATPGKQPVKQATLQALAGAQAAQAEPKGTGLRPGVRGSASAAPAKRRASAGEGEPSRAAGGAVAGKKRKSTEGAGQGAAFDWRRWGER